MNKRKIAFSKGHGTGNDFVIVVDENATDDLSSAEVAQICDRHFGLGADGVLRVVKSLAAGIDAPGTEWFMDYRNSDGSIAEMCGNGLRVFVHFLYATKRVVADANLIATRGGVMKVTRLGENTYRIDMGKPAVSMDPLEVQINSRKFLATSVHIPNPHAVAFVDDLTELGDFSKPPTANPVEAFPNGANFEFIKKIAPNHISMRVFERGSGETLSCGTGVCAAAVVARLNEGQSGETTWRVDVKGGSLKVLQDGNGEVSLIGPAVIVADGEFYFE